MGNRGSFLLQVEVAEFQILVFPTSFAIGLQAQDLVTANLTHFPDTASRASDAEKRLSRASLLAALAAVARSMQGSAVFADRSRSSDDGWGVIQTTSEPSSLVLAILRPAQYSFLFI